MPDNLTQVLVGQGVLLTGAAVQFAVAWLKARTRELEEMEEEE